MATKTWVGTSDGYWDTAANWSPSGVPAADDDVIITGAVSLIGKASGSETTAIVNQCGNLSVIDYTGQIGIPGAPLTFDDTDGFIDNARIHFASSGRIYINLGEGATTGVGTAPIVTVSRTAAVGVGTDYGLYLDAKSLKSLEVTGGSVAVASYPGNALALTTLTVEQGANAPRVLVGPGSTITNYYTLGGEVIINAAATLALLDIQGGSVWKDCSNTMTDVQIRGGTLYWNAGTITAYDLYGGTLDTLLSSTARTATNGNIWGGTYKRHRDAITHTNEPVIQPGVTIRTA